MPRIICLTSLVIFTTVSTVLAQRLEIPRRHEKPPGPPLSAEEAVKRMVVPEGFSVEIVAKEPEVVNPVGMCIDEKGRFWITESFEYPRREPGPGEDRVKVLEDTDGDGKVDKSTIFADGLNIPSGIAVGHGGVWVANAPDILFMQDTDGDLKVDKIEKVVTGFGRTDTHELPNSLTWGPDGWLYGLNGVFNYCDVKYAEDNPNFDPKHQGWKFTCAMFRIHPRTREFQIFAEGTSNPWGIAINGDGEFFISACVIDHLWHIVESAYYIRQGGPYPPHTWPMRSIVDHKHQKAAYCGITWFDSEAYPEEYRGVLYMGNIHGGCINADIAERSGATYKGRPHPGFPAPQGAFENDTVAKIGEGDEAKLADFLTANDAWFMPVVQKVGPDGCLYILDWYDRYHCYQDANADPEGIERSKGRLYKVVYKGHKNRKAEDLGAKSDEDLVALLDDANVYKRETAQRLLQERIGPNTEIAKSIVERVLDRSVQDDQRLRLIWALAGSEAGIPEDLLEFLVTHKSPLISAWGVRIARNMEQANPGIGQMVVGEWLTANAEDPYSSKRFAHLPAVVLRELAPLIQRYEASNGMPPSPEFRKSIELAHVQGAGRQDALITHLVWQNVLQLVSSPQGSQDFVNALSVLQSQGDPVSLPWLDRVVKTLLSTQAVNARQAVLLIEAAKRSGNGQAAKVIAAISRSIQESPPNKKFIDELRVALAAEIHESLLRSGKQPLANEYLFLGVVLGISEAKAVMRQQISQSSDESFRLRGIETLIAAGDREIFELIRESLISKDASREFRAAIIASMGRVNHPQVARLLLNMFTELATSERPKAVEVMTQRDSWSAALLEDIEAKLLEKDIINLNQLKRVASFKNEELQELVAKIYGQIRGDRRSDRQHVINFHRDFLKGTPGDPHKGALVFNKVCAQCHKMYGEGAEVGPDITRNGRSNWEQLLQNVFDPSAVIGPGYQTRQLVTDDGRVLTGLPVEESDERVVLKIQGGKLETVPREKIESYKVSELSMMPEDLEKLLKPQELADLFAYLALDKPPTDPAATILSGAPPQKVRE